MYLHIIKSNSIRNENSRAIYRTDQMSLSAFSVLEIVLTLYTYTCSAEILEVTKGFEKEETKQHCADVKLTSILLPKYWCHVRIFINYWDCQKWNLKSCADCMSYIKPYEKS